MYLVRIGETLINLDAVAYAVRAPDTRITLYFQGALKTDGTLPSYQFSVADSAKALKYLLAVVPVRDEQLPA